MHKKLSLTKTTNPLLGDRIDPTSEPRTSRTDAPNGNEPDTATIRTSNQNWDNLRDSKEDYFMHDQSNKSPSRKFVTAAFLIIFLGFDAWLIWYSATQITLKPTFTLKTPWGTAEIMTPWGKEKPAEYKAAKENIDLPDITKIMTEQINEEQATQTKNKIYKCIKNGRTTFTDQICD